MENKIHLVWLGKKEYPTIMKQTIEFCVKNKIDYKIWTEDNFDIESNEYTKYWYEKKNYSYVSDYIRGHALFYEGGLYIDSDVLLKNNPFDFFGKFGALVTKEGRKYIATSTMGSSKGHPLGKIIIDELNKKKYQKENLRLIICHWLPKILKDKKIVNILKGKRTYNKYYKDFDLFVAHPATLQYETKKIKNYALHYHAATWVKKGDRNIIKPSNWYYIEKYIISFPFVGWLVTIPLQLWVNFTWRRWKDK